MNVEIYIERLVLDGITFAPNGRAILQAAIETELGRLIAERGISTSLLSGGMYPSVTAPDLQINGGNDPHALGTQIAQSIYGGIGNNG